MLTPLCCSCRSTLLRSQWCISQTRRKKNHRSINCNNRHDHFQGVWSKPKTRWKEHITGRNRSYDLLTHRLRSPPRLSSSNKTKLQTPTYSSPGFRQQMDHNSHHQLLINHGSLFSHCRFHSPPPSHLNRQHDDRHPLLYWTSLYLPNCKTIQATHCPLHNHN